MTISILCQFLFKQSLKFFIGPSTNANPQYKSQLSLETAEADATISSLLDSLKKDSSSSSKFQNIDAEKMSELFQISSSLTGNCMRKIECCIFSKLVF